MCANLLAGEKSPYLLQHAHNPVDWHPWGDEAFAEARRRDVPVFLSIGYSTCHWCHVMERESFEREDVAQLLREHFVAIKVDREERPDLDDIYMPATQMMTGRGGWPNSLWLTPDGRPWFAGTYFPPEDRGGAPGFKTVLRALAQVWRERRSQVEAQAAALAQALRTHAAGAAGGREQATREWPARVIADLRGQFDARHGGFGGAPKFPPHAALRLLLDEARLGRGDGAMEMATSTLDALALGGIRDHVGGGFHRYATDDRWFLPHFEKMLYDNALLIRAFAAAFALTGKRLYRTAAQDACDWVLREMTHPDGGFYSALDADSEGVEGRFYLWRRAEIAETLGPAGEEFCRIYGATADGNYHPEHGLGEPGLNILFRAAADDGAAALSDARRLLLARRALRVRPHCDDKVLTDWNGLMLGALAVAGRVLGEPRYTQAAQRAAAFILGRLRPDGRLLHRWRDGDARGVAFLDDYAFLADGLLDLHAATGTDRWLSEARALADTMLDLFADSSGGALFQTARDAEQLIARSKPCHDAATPSGNGVAARMLARLAEATGEERYLRAATDVLSGMSEIMRQAPQLACTAAGAASLLLDMEEQRAPARLTGPTEPVPAHPDGTVEIVLRLAIGSEYHVAVPAAGPAAALPLAACSPADVALDGVGYPPPAVLDLAGTPAKVFRGEVPLRLRLRVAAGALAGERWLSFAVDLQPCTHRECLPKRRATVACRLHISI